MLELGSWKIDLADDASTLKAERRCCIADGIDLSEASTRSVKLINCHVGLVSFMIRGVSQVPAGDSCTLRSAVIAHAAGLVRR